MIKNRASKARCADCGDRDYVCQHKEFGRSDVCDTCMEVRTRFVRGITAGLFTVEQITHCQRGRYTRRKKMEAAMAEAIYDENPDRDPE